MKNYTPWIFLIFLLLNYYNAQAQSCPPPLGGYEITSFSATEHRHIYARDVPGGAPTPNDGNRAVLFIEFHNINIPEAQKSRITYYPTGNGISMGSVQVIYPEFAFLAGTVLRVYAGTNTSAPLLDMVDFTNFSSKKSNNYIHNGPVTIEFYGQTAGTQYSNVIRITSGDLAVPTCNPTRTSTLVWKDFITPNSYTIIDDMQSGGVGFLQGNALLPACIAYFDASKNLVRIEESWCLDASKHASSPGYAWYPGEVTFSLNSATSYDVDGNGYDEHSDNLKIARILYLIQLSQSLPSTENDPIQRAIWETQNQLVDASFPAGSYAAQAQAAIPTVPNPSEPTFSVVLDSPTPEQQPINTNMTVRIPFSWSAIEAGQTNVVELQYEPELDVSLVSGGTLVGKTLTFTDPEAVLSVTSGTPGKYSLQVVYNNPAYFNIRNLQVYEPCDASVQRFLHIGEENRKEPFRQLDLQFFNLATPVKLSSFDVTSVAQEAKLSWGTTEEVDFSHFEVMKSYDLNEWEFLGTVVSTYNGKYHFTDAQLKAGKTTYYRLKMVDLDGTSEFSTIRSINVEKGAKLFTVYPNPASEILYLNYADLKQLENLTIYDERGNTHLHRSGADLLHGIKIANLPQGMHFIQVKTKDGEVHSDKLLIRN